MLLIGATGFAAVSVAGPVQRLDGANLRRFTRHAVEAADAISRRLGWRDPAREGSGRGVGTLICGLPGRSIRRLSWIRRFSQSVRRLSIGISYRVSPSDCRRLRDCFGPSQLISYFG